MCNIEDCESLILNESNMRNYLKYTLSTDNSNTHSKTTIHTGEKNGPPSNHKQRNLFIPREQDTLFWCYYIIKHGDIQYETINNRNILITKQLKIDLVSKIRENKQIVKTYKFDTITNIESNLANDNFMTMKTFMTLCAIDNINILFVSKKTYFECLTNNSEPIYIIREIDKNQMKYNKQYGYEIATDMVINEIHNTLYKVETLDKPIKAISSYKVSELLDIAHKLAIQTTNSATGKNKTKNELYESIIQYF